MTDPEIQTTEKTLLMTVLQGAIALLTNPKIRLVAIALLVAAMTSTGHP